MRAKIQRTDWIRIILFLLIVLAGAIYCIRSFEPFVEVRFRADTNINVNLFYENGKVGDYRFDENHMAQTEKAIPGTNSIKFMVPANAMNSIRIDFGEQPCKIDILSIDLVLSIIKRVHIDFDQIENLIIEQNDVSSVNLDADCLQYVFGGADGYIAITGGRGEYHALIQSNISAGIKIVMLIVISAVICYIDYVVKCGKCLLQKTLCRLKAMFCSIRNPSNGIAVLRSCSVCALCAVIGAVLLDAVGLRLILKVANLLRADTLSHFFSAAGNFSWRRATFFAIFIFILLISVCIGKKKTIQYRYALAGILLVMMTIGGYTGSSIGFYDGMLHGNTADYQCSTLLGIPQGIRGDEWATEKPYYFAQVNGNDGLPYYNKKLMLDGADMAVHAFAPTKDIVTLFRPSLFGFFILPAANAFAFYWWWKILALFMSTYEICYFLTKREQYGLAGAIIVLFSPPNQWWMSQAMIEMLPFGFYALMAYNSCLNARSLKIQTLYMCTVFYCLTGFIFTMYPANQVPFAYIFLAILIWILVINWGNRPFSGRKIVMYVVCAAPFALVLLRFLKMSGPAISTMMNTIYPGNSRVWIPLTRQYGFYQLVNLFTAIVSHPSFLNSCEISQYYSFAIVLIPFMGYLLCRKRKATGVSGLLFIASTFLCVVAWVPQIPLLNKVTLLSMSYPVRITIAYGLGFTLTMISLLPLLEKPDWGISKKYAKLLCGIGGFAILSIATNITEVFDYMKSFKPGIVLLVCFVGLLTVMAYWLITGRENCRKFLISLAAINIASTILVNPITCGTDSMFEKTTMQEIRQINTEDAGRWMVSGSPTISNLVTAQGVARVSGTYYYPDWAMMEIIDPEHMYIDWWNQYAHIDMRITTGENTISIFDEEKSQKVDGTNRIIYVDLETAQKLGIKYIFTSVEVPQELVDSGNLVLEYTDAVDPWRIYKILY